MSKLGDTCRVNLKPGGEPDLCGRDAYATGEFTDEEGNTVYIPLCKLHAAKVGLSGVKIRVIEEADEN